MKLLTLASRRICYIALTYADCETAHKQKGSVSLAHHAPVADNASKTVRVIEITFSSSSLLATSCKLIGIPWTASALSVKTRQYESVRLGLEETRTFILNFFAQIAEVFVRWMRGMVFGCCQTSRKRYRTVVQHVVDTCVADVFEVAMLD